MPDNAIPQDIAEALVTSSAYGGDRIFGAYRWLRANEPLGIACVEGFDPFCVVTRHADILEISRNNALYPSAVRGTTLTSKAGEARLSESFFVNGLKTLPIAFELV